MQLPEYEVVVFKRAPLRLMVGQLGFPVLPRFDQPGFVGQFADSLKKDYPGLTRDHQVTVQVTPTGVDQGRGETIWRFTSRDKVWSIALSESAITLEARDCSSVEDFIARLDRVLRAASEHLGVVERTRLGLRYVNEMRHPNGETLAGWSRLLRSDLLGFAATNLLGGPVEHMIQEVRVQRDDGMLAIRHGLLTGSILDSPPENAPARGRFYLIDMDFYDPTECAVDVEEALAQIRIYDNVMYRLFRWTLGDALFEYLGPASGE
jgi:uncharacterized protein (TIGR04255 family)